MKDLKGFIKESLYPRGDFKVVDNFPTSDCQEFYAYANKDFSQIDKKDLQDVYEEAQFDKFLAYAKKKRWKKDKDGYYIIPKGTDLFFDTHLSSAPHIGLFHIDWEDVYLPLAYDSLNYGEYDDYLKEI